VPSECRASDVIVVREDWKSDAAWHRFWTHMPHRALSDSTIEMAAIIALVLLFYLFVLV
jgi:hypothetical protein